MNSPSALIGGISALPARTAVRSGAAPVAIQGFGLPWPIGLPGCAPAPAPGVPSDDTAAVARWRQGHDRFMRLYTAGLAHVPGPNEVTPSRATLFRNACQWIAAGEVQLVLVSVAAAPRQSAASDLYFDEHNVFPATSPDPANATAGFGDTWGSCDGTTMWLVDLMHPDWTDGLIEDTLIHEIQHDAGTGPSDEFSQDPAMVEMYQSEFRARWLEANATADYGDPTQPAPTGATVTWDDHGTPRSRAVTGFGNARQHGIFMTLAGIPSSYEFVARLYVTDVGFRGMVRAYTDPVGGNLVNSIRIEALTEQIATGKAPEVVLTTAAEGLDVTDRRFLADRAVAADFWDAAGRHLTVVVVDQLGYLVDHPGTHRVHVVVQGETLSIIARDQLGDLERWHELFNLPVNRAVIGNDRDLITPGLVILVPRR